MVDANGYTPLHYAAKRGTGKSIAELLIKNKANINAQGIDGETPLHCAVELNNAYIVSLLIENGAEKDIKDNEGNRPLDWIMRKPTTNRQEVLEVLLENDADISIKNNKGKTPLQLARKIDLAKIIELIKNKQIRNKNGLAQVKQ